MDQMGVTLTPLQGQASQLGAVSHAHETRLVSKRLLLWRSLGSGSLSSVSQNSLVQVRFETLIVRWVLRR